MNRKYYHNRNCRLSYLDFGGTGETIIALHGHLGCASMYARLEKEIPDLYRVVALDQRGHGFSDWGNDYTREAYLSDILALYQELKINKAIIIGHSLGGVNAYQFAAKYPELVSDLIIEDIGTVIDNDLSYTLKWPSSFSSLRLFRDFLTEQGIKNCLYFMESLIRKNGRWQLQFDSKGLQKSQQNLNGNWSADWNKIQCNTLLMRGKNSDTLSADQAQLLTRGKDNMALIEFDNCGHTIRNDNFEEFKNTVLDFLIITGHPIE